MLGAKTVCEALGVSRATFYRRKGAPTGSVAEQRHPSPPRSLGAEEQRVVLDVLHSPRFVDKAPAEAYATLLDDGIYVASVSTMYRVLRRAHEVRERRNQLRHPKHKKPELRATGPNQVWSWDITKLRGPVAWTYFYLYVVLDIFSRNAVGWMLSEKESGALASRLIDASCRKQDIQRGRLTVHNDHGSPMKSKTFTQLLGALEITKSFSRPRVSNDNPFSEAQFKTLKYRPEFPGRFENFRAAETFCREFFRWYNREHRHHGIGFLTPGMVHYGETEAVLEKRRLTLGAAYDRHPERFVRCVPVPPRVPTEVWINGPRRPKNEKKGIVVLEV